MYLHFQGCPRKENLCFLFIVNFAVSKINNSNGKKRKILTVSLSLSTGMLILGLSLALYSRNRKKHLKLKKEGKSNSSFFFKQKINILLCLGKICHLMTHIAGRHVQDSLKDHNDQNHEQDVELPLLDLATITRSTNNFSLGNKIGEGGFGPVYKVTIYKTFSKTIPDSTTDTRPLKSREVIS